MNPRTLGFLRWIAFFAVVGLTTACGGGQGGSSALSPPTLQPGSGTYAAGQVVTLTAPASDAVVYYTTDGSDPQNTKSVLSPNFTGGTQQVRLLASAKIQAFATSGGKTSETVSASYAITPPPVPPAAPDYPTGFAGNAAVQLNGDAVLSGTRVTLTADRSAQVGSVFFALPVDVRSFSTTFSFQISTDGAAPITTANIADGITFTVQGVGPFALGSRGGGLGYGPDPTLGGYVSSIGHSVAVKFDTFGDLGEGSNSTGLYTNGVSPVVPADTLPPTIDLHSGHVFVVQLVYDGANLTLTITDDSASAPKPNFTKSYPVDIPSAVGASTAYVGFTASTGSWTSRQEILTWTFAP